MVKNGKRVTKKGKFVVPTVEEQARDRKQYLESKEIEMIQDADNLRHMWLTLLYQDLKLQWRMDQLENAIEKNNETEGVNDYSYEAEYGMFKPVDLVKAEIDIATNIYNTQLREYTHLRDKFFKEYGFTEDEINTVLENKIDIRKKAKDVVKGKAENSKVNK